MQKKILNEINDMRVKMGLNVLTENSILLTEGPMGAMVKNIVGKVAIKDVEKALIDKFISGSLDDVEKIAFKDFLKSTNGTKFIKEFESAIAKETDPVTKLRAQAYLDNQIKSKLKSTVSSLPGRASTTGGKSTGKGGSSKHMMPDPNPTHIPSLGEIAPSTVDDIIKINRSNPRFNEYMVMLDNANLSPQVKDLMVVSYSKVGNDAVAAIKYAEELTRMLNEKKYGWLKRQINKAMKDPSRTISVGGRTIAVGTLWYVTTVAVLGAGSSVLAWLAYLKSQLPKPPGTSTESNGGYSYDESGLIKYLTDTYGDKGFGDSSKFDIVQSSNGILKVTGKQDGKTKKYKRIGNTYQQQN